MKQKLNDIQVKHDGKLQSFREFVTEMLEDMPQCNWIRQQFVILAESVKQVDINCASIQSLEMRMIQAEERTSDGHLMGMSDTSLPHIPIAAITMITNELEEWEKRKNSVVLHNIPETNCEEADVSFIAKVL